MKQLSRVAIAAVFLASAYPVVAAEGAGESVKGAANATGRAVKNGAEATGHAVKGAAEKTGEALGFATGEPVVATAAEATEYKAAETAEHKMTGTITSIDHKDGAINLKTDQATLNLRFAPAAVRDLKDNEQATVELAFVKLPVEKGGTRAYDQPAKGHHAARAAAREHWMKGTVDDIDHKTGVFDFKTGTATLRLHFPPDKISTLNDGDQVAVAMEITAPKKAM